MRDHDPVRRPASAAGFPACLAVLLVLSSSSIGCAYVRDRAADLADVFTIEAGVGIGLSVDVKATDYVHVGLGYAHLRKVGLHGRDLVNMRDREIGLPVSGVLVAGAWRDGQYERLAHLHTDIPDLLAWQDPWRRADLEVGATLGFVHVRVGFSPGHLLDFLAGIVGLDPAGDDRGAPAEDPAEPGMRWLSGDLHEHGEPPDRPGHAPIAPEETVALARANGLDFAGLNPHFWTDASTDDEALVAFYARAATLCAEPGPPVVMPGFEVTSSSRGSRGHALLLFRRPGDAYRPGESLRGEAFVRRSHARLGPRDCLLIPTHPRTRDLDIPFFPDWAKPWPGVDVVSPQRPVDAAPSEDLSTNPFDGLEALTLLHHLAELGVGRSGEELALADVFHVLDARIGAEKRRYIATGGSDNHRDVILPTFWVLARDRTRDDIFDALVEGRICVGGLEASSLEARSDLEPRWRAIGADVRARAKVELRWSGTATLVVDGRELPAASGGYTHEIEPGTFHCYRLEAGPGLRSRSNWIYVNRPG